MVILGVIIFGGVRRIAEVAELVVPFMAIGYFILALVAVGLHASQMPSVLREIIGSAMGFEPAIGGGIGSAVMFGVESHCFTVGL